MLGKAVWVNELKNQSAENLAAIVAAVKTKLNEMQAEVEVEMKEKEVATMKAPLNVIGKHDVFISYSTKDTDKALEVRGFFEADGLTCWMAPRDIEGADDYNTSIPDAIRNSIMLVVLLSPQAEASKWVCREVTKADNTDLRIYPIVIEPVELRNMEMVLSLCQSKELDKEGLEAISSRAKVIVNETRKSKGLSPIEEKPLPVPELKSSAIQNALNELEGNNPMADQDVLHIAIMSGGNDVYAKDSIGQTALHWLCSSGPKTEQELVVLRQLLSLKPDLNAVAEVVDPNDPEETIADSTPLHCAAMYGDVAAARLLLLNGAEPNEKNEEGKTPWEATYDDDVEHLLQFFVNGQLDFFDNPLVKRDANDSLAQNLERRPYKTQRILNTIVGGVDDFNLRDALGKNILHWAAWKNEPELCEILLKRGADIGVTDNAGNTPLRLAFKSNALEAEKVLLQWAEERSLETEALEGDKSRIVSVEVTEVTKANEDLEKALLSKSPQKAKNIFQAVRDGATDLTAADEKGHTALHWAVSKNEMDIIKIILDRGGDVNAQTHQHNETPLHYAAQKDFAKVAAELIARGALLEDQQVHGNTPLMEAAGKGAVEVIRVLIDAGANVNAKGSETHYTALHRAAETDQSEVAKLLIQAGADVNAKSSEEYDSQTTLDIAKEFESLEVSHLLKQAGAK